MNTFTRTLGVLCGLATASFGQLVREANTTLALPADLPAATGYVTQNALGALTFALPMCTAFPAGETNRLFVAERGSGSVANGNLVPGTIQMVTNLSTTPVKTQ